MEMIQTLEYRITGDYSAKKRPDISYWLNDPADISNVTVSAAGGDPQIIYFEFVWITYGERAYFKCPSCDLVVSKLYLPKGSKEFKCRKCHGLQYYLTTFNKNSVAGRQFYKMDRLQKLAKTRESMGRIFYKGEYSKKFKRFLGLCEKAGFYEDVKSAQNLMELIKG
jgi:hypothetical protein